MQNQIRLLAFILLAGNQVAFPMLLAKRLRTSCAALARVRACKGIVGTAPRNAR